MELLSIKENAFIQVFNFIVCSNSRKMIFGKHFLLSQNLCLPAFFVLPHFHKLAKFALLIESLLERLSKSKFPYLKIDKKNNLTY